MSEPLRVFLQAIPGILFEAIAVAAVLGLLLAAVLCAKRPFGKFYWLVAGMLIYMLIWRILIQIISSRYAEILLYPAVIASVYACFKVPELIEPFIKKYIPQKIWRFLPYALVGGLCIACFCKTVRLNPYNSIGTTTKIIQQDYASSKADNVLIFSETRAVQYRYYSGLPTKQCPPLLLPDGTPDEKKIYALIRNHSRKMDVLYFANMEPADKEPIQLKVKNSPDPAWKLIGQEYIDRRKKKMIRVYRYTVSRKK